MRLLFLLELGCRLCEDDVGGFAVDWSGGEIGGASFKEESIGVREVGGGEVGVGVGGERDAEEVRRRHS